MQTLEEVFTDKFCRVKLSISFARLLAAVSGMRLPDRKDGRLFSGRCAVPEWSVDYADSRFYESARIHRTNTTNTAGLFGEVLGRTRLSARSRADFNRRV